MSYVLQRQPSLRSSSNNASFDSKSSSATATQFKESLDTMVDVMKLQIGGKYHRFISHLRRRCLGCIRRGQKKIVHLYYRYPVPNEGYKSVLKVHKFLKRDVGLDIKELKYKDKIVGFVLPLDRRSKGWSRP